MIYQDRWTDDDGKSYRCTDVQSGSIGYRAPMLGFHLTVSMTHRISSTRITLSDRGCNRNMETLPSQRGDWQRTHANWPRWKLKRVLFFVYVCYIVMHMTWICWRWCLIFPLKSSRKPKRDFVAFLGGSFEQTKSKTSSIWGVFLNISEGMSRWFLR